MNIDEWFTDKKIIQKSKRYYVHFDSRTNISKCREYISNPNNIIKHGFYPFIHYVKHIKKFSSNRNRKDKKRDICYAAHIDRCIFQYYNFLLSELYNDKVKQLEINDVAVAYRNNFYKKCNIDFAYTAFRFIIDNKQCYIMVGDFTNFFDNLDHIYLKKQWCNLLATNKLPPDHYAIYKNITRYSFVELADLLKLNCLGNNSTDIKKLNKKERVLTPEQFKVNKKIVKKNQEKGIPQGSPLSGLLANMYMLEVDKVIWDYVKKFNGMYMRYSDDFVIILPNLEEQKAIQQFKRFISIFNDYPGLELQPEKTQYYHYSNDKIVNCGAKVERNADISNIYLSFLGFIFDGKYVNLRDKTISKFYYRMRKKAKTIVKNNKVTKKGNKINNGNIYQTYSIKCFKYPGSNFLKYARHSSKKFSKNNINEKIYSKIMQRNMFKVYRFLNEKYKKNNDASYNN